MWSEQRGSGSRHAILLAEAVKELGLEEDRELRAQVRRRIECAAHAEWQEFGPLAPEGVTAGRAKHLLGAGFSLTAFLVAPVYGDAVEHAELCHLGGIVNLMVVVCDSLLDGGARGEDVLPARELKTGGGEGSAVMILLREFMRGVMARGVDARLLKTVEKALQRMFEAESGTVGACGAIDYRYWLRKSALPFVVMAIPAWGGRRLTDHELYRQHVRWLYRVGRFLGAVDDAVDFLDDCRTGHPNCWRAWDRNPAAAAHRVAMWGKQILEWWDSLVPRTTRSAVLRETFLHNVWEWLEPAIHLR